MTTKRSQIWNDEKFQKAETDHKYINLSGNNAGSKLLLSGAKNMWAKAPTSDYVYVSSLRVAGHPRDILRTFTELGHDVSAHVAGGYTVANQPAEYLAELASLKAYQAANKPVKSTKVHRSVFTILEDLKSLNLAIASGAKVTTVKGGAVPAKKAKSPRSPKKGGKKAPRASPKRGPRDLLTRLNNVKAGKVLDASTIRPDGTGINTIVEPPSGRSKKMMVGGLRLVSNDPQKYAQAIAMLPAEYAPYITEFNALWTRGPATSPLPPAARVATPARLSPRLAPRTGSATSPGLPVSTGVGLPRPGGLTIPLGGSVGSPRSLN